MFGEVQDIPGCCYRGGIRHHSIHIVSPQELQPIMDKDEICFSIPTLDVHTFAKMLNEAMTTRSTVS